MFFALKKKNHTILIAALNTSSGNVTSVVALETDAALKFEQDVSGSTTEVPINEGLDLSYGLKINGTKL